jgi:hypothetical protein
MNNISIDYFESRSKIIKAPFNKDLAIAIFELGARNIQGVILSESGDVVKDTEYPDVFILLSDWKGENF